MNQTKGRSLLLTCAKGNCSLEELFTEELHGVGTYPSTSLFFGAEVTLEYAECNFFRNILSIPDFYRECVWLFLNPYLDQSIFIAGFNGIYGHIYKYSQQNSMISSY